MNRTNIEELKTTELLKTQTNYLRYTAGQKD